MGFAMPKVGDTIVVHTDTTMVSGRIKDIRTNSPGNLVFEIEDDS